MSESNTEATAQDANDFRTMIRQVIREFVETENVKTEPAYKAELVEERRRREHLERRVNELVEENHRSRAMAEETERFAAIRSELQRQGVTKLDLAFKALKDDVRRDPEGRLVGAAEHGEVSLKELVTHFVSENPEFLPARITGGSGASGGSKGSSLPGGTGIDMERIRPGMSREDLDQIRQEVARVALQSLSGR
jgi:hypothetical protein